MTIYLVVIFMVLAIVFYLLISIVSGMGRRRTYFITEPNSMAAAMKKPFSMAGSLDNFLKPLNFIIEPLSHLQYIKKLKQQSEVLRIDMNVYALVFFKLALAILCGVIATTFISVLYGLLGVFFGFFVPDAIMLNKFKKKKQDIVRIFPETIDLLDMCVSAGADFLSAIKWVVEKSKYNPFIEQLGVVLSEVQVGKTRAEALKDMARRLNIPEVNSFVRSVVQSERMGTPIEETFKNLSEDTRTMRFEAGERYAIKASLKILFPLIFCILPAVMIVVAGPIIIKFTEGELIPKGAF
ncbi:MAG: type II secretion system F family protein [Candidatus Omnitrophica bacterium]|nr:type II secretion system F family protein [Candidatus Omnitrophota bacterium]